MRILNIIKSIILIPIKLVFFISLSVLLLVGCSTIEYRNIPVPYDRCAEFPPTNFLPIEPLLLNNPGNIARWYTLTVKEQRHRLEIWNNNYELYKESCKEQE